MYNCTESYHANRYTISCSLEVLNQPYNMELKKWRPYREVSRWCLCSVLLQDADVWSV